MVWRNLASPFAETTVSFGSLTWSRVETSIFLSLSACLTVGVVSRHSRRSYLASRLSGGRSRGSLFCRHGAARVQRLDFARAEPELLENLLVVFSQRRGALRRHLGDAMHLNGTADCRIKLTACAVKRNDNVVHSQLWILDDLLRSSHGAERDVNATKYLVPMRHRLSTEYLVENLGQEWPFLRQLDRISKSRIGQKIRPSDGFRHRRQLVRCDDKHKPGVIRRAIHIECCVGGMQPVVQPEEIRSAQRGLDRNACRPDTLREQRCADIGPLAGAFATIQGRHDRRVQADCGGIVTHTTNRPSRRRPENTSLAQQPVSCQCGGD